MQGQTTGYILSSTFGQKTVRQLKQAGVDPVFTFQASEFVGNRETVYQYIPSEG